VAHEVSKIIVANKANVIDVIVATNEAIVTDTANSANKANKASFAEANKLLANDGIAIILYSLTKHCEVFVKDKGYFGMTISNNQHGKFGRQIPCLLEDCDPVVLVLVLTLVLVGQPSAGACGSKKMVLLALLHSIHLLQNYEHSIILE
jgi:hypothetical protein